MVVVSQEKLEKTEEPIVFAAEETFQQEENKIEDQPTKEPRLKEHQKEADQAKETQRMESRAQELPTEFCTELAEEKSRTEQSQTEMRNEEMNEIPTVQFDSKSVENEYLSVEDYPRGNVFSNQSESSVLISMVSSSRASNASDVDLLEREQTIITADADKRQEDSSLTQHAEENVKNCCDDAEPLRPEGCEGEHEESREIDELLEGRASTTTTTIKIVKVSVKQRMKCTDFESDHKAHESSV